MTEPQTLSSDDRATIEQVYSTLIQSPALNHDECIVLKIQDLKMICERATDVLKQDPVLLDIKGPVYVVGDLHGQFNDLMQYLEKGGSPSETKYLFLGDYVDRGAHSLEVITTLLCMKILYPENVYLLRGNHETETISEEYGFLEECKKRFNRGVWKNFNEVFRYLPLAAVVSERIFCVHGGISREMQTLDDIRELQRPINVPEKGFVADLLWADPDRDSKGFQESERGTSYTFGDDAADDFLEKYDFDLIARAHQVVDEGYEFPFFPLQSVVTVFSASNYCRFENKGAMLRIEDDLSCSFDFVEPNKELVETPPEE